MRFRTFVPSFTSDKIVIADADDSDNPKTVTVQSIVDLSPGDITGVTAGTGISGGGTSTGTLNFAPSELSSVTVATDDKVVIADTSDSDNPKHVTVSQLLTLSHRHGWIYADTVQQLWVFRRFC